jgi:uncharacterized membrane protein YagU involved in acid resistance
VEHPYGHSHVPSKDTIEMPAPTPWPMVFAFGLTMFASGLVTHWTLSAVGLVIGIRAVVGWWGQVIPVEEHEFVPCLPEAERAEPVRTSRRSVVTLQVGMGHHRMRIPEKVHPYRAGIWGGLAGGAAMALLAVAYGLFAQHSIWYPINLLAAMVLPGVAASSVEALRAFRPVEFGVAFVAHGLLSILVGVLYAVTLPMFPRRAPLWAGLVAPLFWSGLIAATLDLLNPVLNERVNWPWFVISQLGFGLVCGYVIAKSQHIDTIQNLPFMQRAGFEGQFGREADEDKK